jgi:hypothetical protein
MADPTAMLDTFLGDFLADLADDERIAGAMATLNTDGSGLAGYEIIRAAFVDGDPSRIAFSADAYYHGAWDPERPRPPTTIIAAVTGVATLEGSTWTVTDAAVGGVDVVDDFVDGLDDDDEELA